MEQYKLEGGIEIFSALMSFIFLCNIKRASYFEHTFNIRVTPLGNFNDQIRRTKFD